MKRHLLIGLFLIANAAVAQDISQSQVPKAVADSFEKNYPEARSVEWKLDGGYYKVKFEASAVPSHHKVWYNPSGEWVLHEEKILKGDLPPRVLDSMYVHFSGYRLDDEIEKITERHRVTYTLELTKDAEEWKVVYDADGVMLSKRED